MEQEYLEYRNSSIKGKIVGFSHIHNLFSI